MNRVRVTGTVPRMASSAFIDVAAGFKDRRLLPIPIDEAVQRVLAYCTFKDSGWSTYDLPAVHARSIGLLDQVTVWSLLFANALNGRVEFKQLSSFDRTLRRRFADLLGAIPADRDLHRMDDAEVAAVVRACQFGFDGAWAAKITKLGALYRPRAIPVLDGHVALAFGYQSGDLSTRVRRHGLNREERIDAIVRALAGYLREQQTTMARLRAEVSQTVPELAATAEADDKAPLISDLRLLDIVLWTAMDDHPVSRNRRSPKWLDRPIGVPVPREAAAPEPIRSA